MCFHIYPGLHGQHKNMLKVLLTLFDMSDRVEKPPFHKLWYVSEGHWHWQRTL